MSDAAVWSIIAGLAVLTYLIRFSFIGFLGNRVLPNWLERALGFVPVTVMPAIAAPAMVALPSGSGADPAILLGSAATIAAGIATRSLFGGFAAGMVVYHAVGFSL